MIQNYNDTFFLYVYPCISLVTVLLPTVKNTKTTGMEYYKIKSLFYLLECVIFKLTSVKIFECKKLNSNPLSANAQLVTH